MARPIGIDLFAGAGGMTLGFEQAGFDIVAAVEYDPVHAAVHEFNFPLCATLCKSVTDVCGDDIRNAANIGTRDIDVVFGGPPCQGVSLMGKRALDDPRNQLMTHFVRLVTELKPRYFVMENVKGLTIGSHRQLLLEIIEQLEHAGYDVVKDYRVLNAASYGVPQDRRRLFLLGARKGERGPNYPVETTQSQGGRNTKAGATNSLPLGPSVWDALCDLPNADNFNELLNRDFIDAEFGTGSGYSRFLHGERATSDYSYIRDYDLSLLTSSMRTIHTQLSADRFAATNPGDVEPVSRFPRLDMEGICNTLRAGTGSDRGAYTSPRPIHPIYPRCITVREAARLHSYPDWFRFHCTKWHGFRQVGNSVPPLLARAVATSVMVALGLEPEHPARVLHVDKTELLGFDMTAAAAYFATDRRLLGARLRVRPRPIDAQPLLLDLSADNCQERATSDTMIASFLGVIN